ncbi:MAG TPA: hypothetical protein EYP14_10060 [Planctomycetaceae bacterium]|nr:hypothetical protein [Planctomycetaceae bacterium]
MIDALINLVDALIQLFLAVWHVAIGILSMVATPPVLPMLLWVAFWLFAVDWVRLRTILLKGGWVAVLLIGLMTILIWGAVAPPATGSHSVLGLQVSNFVGKTVYVTCLFFITALCGVLQLTGCCEPVRRGPERAGQPPQEH